MSVVGAVMASNDSNQSSGDEMDEMDDEQDAPDLRDEPAEGDGPTDGSVTTSGLIRRVRRLLKLSQRELAEELGLSQSAVAKWETGRTSPTARMLARVLALADLGLAAVRADGERVRPMRAEAARDAGGRRYPAHHFVWAQGWWAPIEAENTAWINSILARSAMFELPRVRYSRWWELGGSPTLTDLDDHPTWAELVAEARAGRTPRVRNLLRIPEWAIADSHRSRNRRPEAYRSFVPPRPLAAIPRSFASG